jgi:hypothetical protein
MKTIQELNIGTIAVKAVKKVARKLDVRFIYGDALPEIKIEKNE